MGESWPTSPVQTERSEVYTSDRGQNSPIQTDLTRLIRCLLYGQTRKQRNKKINNFICFPAQAQAFSWLSVLSLVSSPNGTKTTVQSPALYTLCTIRKPSWVFRLPTSDFRLPTSVAMKGDDRPTRLLPYAKMLLVPKTFFSLLLGRLCFRRFWLSRLFHIERSWHTYRFTVVFVSGRQDLPSDARGYSVKLFITAE